jgi:hypothetical protein
MSTKNMPIRKNSEIQRNLIDIHRLMQANKSDEEIMHTLNLPLRTFQRYKKRIHDHNKAIWYQITRNELETELLRLKNSFEDTFRIAKQKVNDPTVKDSLKLEWLSVKDNARINIIKLLVDGTREIRKIQMQ